MNKHTSYSNTFVYLSFVPVSLFILDNCANLIRSSNEAEKFVSENIDDIMRVQEKHFGLPSFSPPNVVFPYFMSQPFLAGEYKDGEISLSLNFSSFIIPTHPIRNKFVRFTSFGHHPSPIDYVLAHELGHFYVDQICIRYSVPTFPDTPEEITEENKDSLQGWHLIHEGVAEYFARLVISQQNNYGDKEYTQEAVRLIYPYSYSLVAPIVDQYGVEGILSMIRDPPQGQELYEQLPQWQKRVLEMLEQKAK